MDELPDHELETIVSMKGAIAPSYAQALVRIMRDLQTRRSRTNLLAGRSSYITIRSLLKCAKMEPVGYQELAEAAYVVLAEGLRTEQERETVR
jgi:midasin